MNGRVAATSNKVLEITTVDSLTPASSATSGLDPTPNLKVAKLTEAYLVAQQ